MDMEQKRKANRIASELFRIARLSVEAAELVLPVIQDKNLKAQVKRQREAYCSTAGRSAAILRKCGLEPAEKQGLMDRVLRRSLQADTAWDKSAPHIAKIAIHCTGAAMKDLTKTMNRFGDEDTESRRLAEEYLEHGQKDIDLLKRYL